MLVYGSCFIYVTVFTLSTNRMCRHSVWRTFWMYPVRIPTRYWLPTLRFFVTSLLPPGKFHLLSCTIHFMVHIHFAISHSTLHGLGSWYSIVKSKWPSLLLSQSYTRFSPLSSKVWWKLRLILRLGTTIFLNFGCYNSSNIKYCSISNNILKNSWGFISH